MKLGAAPSRRFKPEKKPRSLTTIIPTMEKHEMFHFIVNNNIILVEISHIYKMIKDRIKQNPVVILLLVGCQSDISIWSIDHFNNSNKKNVLNYALLCFAISLRDIYA